MCKKFIYYIFISSVLYLVFGSCIIPGINTTIDTPKNLANHQLYFYSPQNIESFSDNPPSVEWFRQYGDSDRYDIGQSLKQTSDGGYIIVGVTESYGAGSYDIWLIKTSSTGMLQWEKTFGGSNEDWGFSVDITDDGGYILTGYTRSFGLGGSDLWLIKTNSFGIETWSKTFGGTGNDIGYLVQQTTDEGFVIIGSTTSYGSGNWDVWLIKTDSNGVELWKKTFGGINDDQGYSGQQLKDGGFIVTGYTETYGVGKEDVWLIKTDSDGDELWNKSYGTQYDDYCQSIQQTDDDGFILAGTIHEFGLGGDFWLIKTDSSGIHEWNASLNGQNANGYAVQQTTDGGYIVAGQSDINIDGMSDIWLVKTDSSGHERWNTSFPGPLWSICYSVQQTNDGGYVLTGHTAGNDIFYGNVFLLKYSGESGPINKTVFMMGRISNLQENSDSISFNAVKVREIQFKPFSFTMYNSNELISIAPEYVGLLNKNLLFGFFKIII